MASQNTTADDMPGARALDRRSPGRFTTWAYRAATGLILALMTVSGVANVLRPNRVIVELHHLGYPDYFPIMLGVAKLLWVVALTLPGTRRLKEWAYAGFTFDLLAAFVSHYAVRDGTLMHPPLLVAMFVLAVSYTGFLRRTVLLDVADAGGAT